MKSYLICVFLLVAVAACATKYEAEGLLGGFSETQLAPNMYRVDFKGNSMTDVQRVQDFALLRSAELTVANGFKYFAIINSNTDLNTETHVTPIHVNTNVNAYSTGRNITANARSSVSGGNIYQTTEPSTSNLILMLESKPSEVFSYDAFFLVQSLKKKYAIEEVK